LEEDIQFHSELKRDKGNLLTKNDSNFTIESQQLINREDNINNNNNVGFAIKRDDSINFANNSSGFGNADESFHDNKNEFEMNIESKNDDNMQFVVDDDFGGNTNKSKDIDNLGVIKNDVDKVVDDVDN